MKTNPKNLLFVFTVLCMAFTATLVQAMHVDVTVNQYGNDVYATVKLPNVFLKEDIETDRIVLSPSQLLHLYIVAPLNHEGFLDPHFFGSREPGSTQYEFFLQPLDSSIISLQKWIAEETLCFPKKSGEITIEGEYNIIEHHEATNICPSWDNPTKATVYIPVTITDAFARHDSINSLLEGYGPMKSVKTPPQSENFYKNGTILSEFTFN